MFRCGKSHEPWGNTTPPWPIGMPPRFYPVRAALPCRSHSPSHSYPQYAKDNQAVELNGDGHCNRHPKAEPDRCIRLLFPCLHGFDPLFLHLSQEVAEAFLGGTSNRHTTGAYKLKHLELVQFIKQRLNHIG